MNSKDPSTETRTDFTEDFQSTKAYDYESDQSDTEQTDKGHGQHERYEKTDT